MIGEICFASSPLNSTLNSSVEMENDMSNTIWQQINQSMQDTIETLRESVVQIVTEEGSIGAGTIWHSEGLIITNAHVILQHNEQPRGDLSVVLQDDGVYPAQVIGYDTSADLAALAIDVADLPTISPGTSANLVSGQWVMAVGHPWGLIDSLTSGVIIGIGTNLPERFDDREWIAISLKLRPGHSGGPLVDVEGRLIGINTMIAGPEVGFAIPVNVVKRFLKQTITGL